MITPLWLSSNLALPVPDYSVAGHHIEVRLGLQRGRCKVTLR